MLIEELQDIIKNAAEENPQKMKDNINTLLAQKIMTAIETKRDEVANRLFNNEHGVEIDEAVSDVSGDDNVANSILNALEQGAISKELADQQLANIGYEIVEEEVESLDERSYSAKAAKEGKDIGKPGKNFSKIEKSAAKKYGSKEAGERVAGAVLAKLRHKG